VVKPRPMSTRGGNRGGKRPAICPSKESVMTLNTEGWGDSDVEGGGQLGSTQVEGHYGGTSEGGETDCVGATQGSREQRPVTLRSGGGESNYSV